MSINFDLYYYKNIMVKHTDICINDLSDDYITLKITILVEQEMNHR